jgi:hypothetical protein
MSSNADYTKSQEQTTETYCTCKQYKDETMIGCDNPKVRSTHPVQVQVVPPLLPRPHARQDASRQRELALQLLQT